MNNFVGLTQINCELTSRCDKNCWMCGRRERERLYGNQDYGDMDFDMVELIADEVPTGIIVAFHNNGEPLLYPRLGEAISLFRDQTTYFVSNGLTLMKRANELIDNLDIISVSVIENEREEVAERQYNEIIDFLSLKGDRKPRFILRFVGKADEKRYKDLDVLKVRRVLHLPRGSVGYRKPPTIPEHGVCLDLLNRLAIDRFGNVSLCVRFDPEGELRLGNISETPLVDLWNCEKRKKIVGMHISGQRHKVPYCGDKCEFYGVPTGF